MQNIRKDRTMFNVMLVFLILAFASTAFSSESSMGRIIPKGKVTLYQGSQKIGEFSTEAPFPEDTLLSVQGECGVKLSDLYLVAVDKSLFSVTTNTDSRKLTVQTGTVYFSLSSMPHTLVFQTPEGVVTTREVMVEAASNGGSLKGYVFVEPGITRVGVLEGGAMVMMVDDGEPITIESGRELRLAQADTVKGSAGAKAAGEAGAAAGKSTIVVVTGAAAPVVSGYVIEEDNNDSGSPSSP